MCSKFCFFFILTSTRYNVVKKKLKKIAENLFVGKNDVFQWKKNVCGAAEGFLKGEKLIIKKRLGLSAIKVFNYRT